MTRRAKWENWKKTQELFYKKTSTNYHKWDMFESSEEEISALVGTASFLMLTLGLVGTLVFILLSPTIVYNVLKIPPQFQNETLVAFYLLSASIPLVTSTAGTVGILSALQRFDLVNVVRIPLGLLMFLGPVLVLPFSHSLVPVIAVLLGLII